MTPPEPSRPGSTGASRHERSGLERFLELAADRVKRHRAALRDTPITPGVAAGTVRSHLAEHYADFATPWTAERLVEDVGAMMTEWNLHVTHPRYFGLFNPSVFPAGVAADLLVAAFNPQLAAWSHAPAANEIERHTLRYLAARLGLDPEHTTACFAAGGAEANQSALLAALAHALPAYAETGLAETGESPAVYVTSESHHSIEKAAGLCGLGRRSVRTVKVDADLRMDPAALGDGIDHDRRSGLLPLMVVGTAGTTGGGIVDPLADLADVCARQDLWLHVDAAWGGAACLSPRLRPVLAGIERADSVTWDAHKWLSVPMGAGMFFCTHPDAVRHAFAVPTPYMPAEVADTVDPYASTIQWTRRHIGLKVFMSLASLGAAGYGQAIEHQAAMGDRLRAELGERGWRVVNRTALPVVCFSRRQIDDGEISAARVASRLARRNFWVSPVRLGGRDPVLRACITSYETTADDVTALAEAATVAASSPAGC